nr:4-(cytidine 5'-diphospho)-2-C-methyl-D-erythritol kinase [Clostridia bacterium]
MNTVKIKSYAKVNLTLEITGIENGYHMLDSLVTNIDMFDLLVLKKRKGGLSSVVMKGMGSESIPPEKNNALKAAEAFSKAFGTDGADITVYKNIPIGGGLGGSSADVAGVLNGMAALYKITDRAKLKEIADTLGSDTGYMLDGGFARMQGRGEKVTKLDLTNTLHFLLICPESSVSAGECYRAFDSAPRTLEYRGCQTESCIEFLRKKDLNEGGRYLMNDLFRAAYSLNTDVGKAYEEGASFSPLGVTMTGSGSCVFAMFETKELCEWAKSRYKGKFRTYVVKTVIPDYTACAKKTSKGWRNPFVLSEEEIEEASEE